MKAAFRRIALLAGVSLQSVACATVSSDDDATLGEVNRLRRAGAL